MEDILKFYKPAKYKRFKIYLWATFILNLHKDFHNPYLHLHGYSPSFSKNIATNNLQNKYMENTSGGRGYGCQLPKMGLGPGLGGFQSNKSLKSKQNLVLPARFELATSSSLNMRLALCQLS